MEDRHRPHQRHHRSAHADVDATATLTPALLPEVDHPEEGHPTRTALHPDPMTLMPHQLLAYASSLESGDHFTSHAHAHGHNPSMPAMPFSGGDYDGRTPSHPSQPSHPEDKRRPGRPHGASGICSLCNVAGHNRRRCPVLGAPVRRRRPLAPSPPPGQKKRGRPSGTNGRCTLCNTVGHNRRSCQRRAGPYRGGGSDQDDEDEDIDGLSDDPVVLMDPVAAPAAPAGDSMFS